MTAARQASRPQQRDGHTVTVHIPVTFRQRAGRKQILSPSDSAPWSPAPRVDTALLKAVVRAHRWRGMLESKLFATVRDLAKAEGINESYLGRVLRLTLLSPTVTESILWGKQPHGPELANFLEPFPVEWDKQAILWCVPSGCRT
jgi:hypothetical protein